MKKISQKHYKEAGSNHEDISITYDSERRRWITYVDGEEYTQQKRKNIVLKY